MTSVVSSDATAAASIVATGADPDEVVTNMDPEKRPELLHALDLLGLTVWTWKRCVTAHMIADGKIGTEYEFAGKRFTFENDSRGTFNDIPGLFYSLSRMGMSMSELASAVSDVRITDLEARAEKMGEKSEEALELIREHRDRRSGAPKLVEQNNPYRRKRKTEEAA